MCEQGESESEEKLVIARLIVPEETKASPQNAQMSYLDLKSEIKYQTLQHCMALPTL